MANPLAVTLHAAGAETSAGASTAIDIGTLRSCLKLRLELDAIAGTGARLTVYVETGPSASGPWRGVASFPALTVAASKDQVFADCLRFNRVRWTLDGTAPSATFTVDGAAHALYAKLSDVAVQIPTSALSAVPLQEQAAICLAVTDEADGYLAGGKKLPLTAWDDNLSSKVADMAVYQIMKRRGFQPQGTDELLVKANDDAVTWLMRVSRGDIDPPGIVDSTPDVYDAGISVFSDVPISPAGRWW